MSWSAEDVINKMPANFREGYAFLEDGDYKTYVKVFLLSIIFFWLLNKLLTILFDRFQPKIY